MKRQLFAASFYLLARLRGSLTAAFIALVCTPLFAQAPKLAATPAPAPTAAPAAVSAPAAAGAPATPPKVQNSDLGFSYGLPSDWELVAPPPTAPPGPDPDLPPSAKKGNGCVEVALTARHGAPASVVVVMALPFDCYGQAIAASDLAGLAPAPRKDSRSLSRLSIRFTAIIRWAATMSGLSVPGELRKGSLSCHTLLKLPAHCSRKARYAG